MTTTSGRRPRLTQPQEMPAPVVDDHSATVLDEAIDTLGKLRTPYWLGDSAVRLHALASLLAQTHALLPEAVAQARDQDLTWDQIGQLLGFTATTTARRYRPTTGKDV
jgi:hypothetical protein